MEKTFIGILCFLSFCGFTVEAQINAIADFLKTDGLKHASVGISVVRLSDGKQIATYQSDLSLIPASTQKVVTTATALQLYSPAERIATQVGYSGSVNQQGVLNGDFIIRGGGDPSLASRYNSRKPDHFLNEILEALQKNGIREISGRVIGDESVLGFEGVSPGWLWEDLGNYYAAGVYGLNYADNLFELTLDTSVKGKQPTIKSIAPQIPGLIIRNHLQNFATNTDSAYLYGAPFSNERFLYGAVPQKKTEFKIKGDLPEPALTLAQRVTEYLQNHLIPVAGRAASGRVLRQNGAFIPQIESLLLTYYSDSFAEMAKQTNCYSLNLYAEALLRQIALTGKCSSVGDGVRIMTQYWQKRGIDTGGVALLDGCGLSPSNRITASFLTSLLYQMKDNRAFVESLPLAGVEGTVNGFLRNTPLQGKARLKSGTLRRVLAYTGYIDGTEKYAVAILVNNATCSNRSLRKAMEKMLTEIVL